MFSSADFSLKTEFDVNALGVSLPSLKQLLPVVLGFDKYTVIFLVAALNILQGISVLWILKREKTSSL